ncbi:DUF3600 domain-containing protein [Bacillus salitolerans]|uniref:DUF3600 domain-containing protein n=1 Tax=Bacillus salitolerans TaxID=1437434 RepID=A0ABW4LMC6_9BACI
MNFENQLRRSLQQKGTEVTPPLELKQKIMNKIETKNRSSLPNKRLLIVLITAILIIPTSAFAYNAYLADEFYGTFENLKKHISSVTKESYMLLHAKLLQAKGDLEKEEYEELKDGLKVITSSKIIYGDQYGNIDYDLVPQDKLLEIRNAMIEIQPYINKLNDHRSSKDVLSAEEYDIYIDALMTYEKILVQSRINPSEGFEIDQIDPVLLKDFLLAEGIIENVHNKIKQQSNEDQLPKPSFTIDGNIAEFEYGLPSLSDHTSESAVMKEIDLYMAFSELLKPVHVTTLSKIDVTFDQQPDKLEYQLLKNDGEIYRSGPVEELQLPTESGDYTIVLLGEWNHNLIPYVFVAKVN